ncbi:unnamed protein product [Prorocentrum cordatum]|uniref:Deacetylase sirtuin-type domain-containing protein n=1 Tax=Prorocentrum cordatum TaxID=2364126 RepID=A0ABN9S774_9DINO|nr:unnamed protein product [Polarella glacialis]
MPPHGRALLRAPAASPRAAAPARKASSFAPRGAPVTGGEADDFAEFIPRGAAGLPQRGGLLHRVGRARLPQPRGVLLQGAPPHPGHAEFVGSLGQRKRYWARSLAGWRFFDSAVPNVAHWALAEMERHGYVQGVVTQNVDGLHQKAGTRNVIDLHGRNDEVGCLGCGRRRPRRDFQQELEVVNAEWVSAHLPSGPSVDLRADGDAHLATSDFAGFVVPPCSACGGIWKPTVVFFGGSLEPAVKAAALAAVEGSSGVLVLGSSLQVFSAFSLVKAAAEAGKPVVLVNIGETRADPLVPPERRLAWRCGAALARACELLGVPLRPSPAES